MRCKALKPTSDSRLQDFLGTLGTGSRSVAWLDGMVEILVSARKALEPTSYPRLQDFLDALQSFEAYLRFQPALIFPLAASRQLRRALTIRYRDSSGLILDSNIPGTSRL